MKKKDLRKFITFLDEAEGLKRLLRHSWLSNGRRESVAEHSWRLVLMAMVLAPSLKKPVDISKVIKMVAIHDLCEVHAGDHWAFKKRKLDKYEKEKLGLKKILVNIPKNSQKEIMDLWEEYEEKVTEEAKFAQALDKLEVLIQHNHAPLRTWNKKEKDFGFNLVYGESHCSFDETMCLLRELVKEDTINKLKRG